jgi:hypothetical protein
MGAGGAGFAQGFAQTLTTLGPIIQRNQQERESLELQKKLATASLAKHEAETKLVTLRAESLLGLRDAMTNGVQMPGSEQFDSMGLSLGQQPGERVPYDPTNAGQQRALLPMMLMADPSGAHQIIGQNMKDAAIDKRLARFGPAFQDFAQGGGQPTQAAQVGPSIQPASGAGTPPPASGARPGLGPIQDMDRGMEFNPATGEVKLTAKRGQKDWKVETGYVDLPDGRKQLWRSWTNPVTGEVAKQEPAGAPVYPQELAKYAQVAQSFGLDPKSPQFGDAIADISRAAMLPPDQQTPAMAALAKKYTQARPAKPGVGSTAATPARGGTIEEQAMADARTEKVLTEAATVAAKIQTELKNKPLEGAAKDKYVALESIQRKSVRALELFRPEYVGKPFIDKFKGEFAKAEKLGKDYTPGALAGAMREFFGNATPEEVEFRRSILEMADDVLRARSGAAISESEYKRVTGFLAQLSDEPTTFKAAMERVVKDTTAQMESAVKLATTPASKLAPTTPEPKKKDPGKVQLGGSIRRNASGMLEYVPAGRK